MGIEYEFLVPQADRAAVSAALRERLEPLLQAHAPHQNGAHPHVTVAELPGGVYFCDHLSDPVASSRVFRALVDLVLSCSSGVTVTEL